MPNFALQPDLYSTHGAKTLLDELSILWPLTPDPKNDGGLFYLVAGFGQHNGGLPFYERFRHHTENGGHVKAVFSGSKGRAHASKQLARALISSGAQVTIVRRNKMMHAKLYGVKECGGNESLVVTSGNFTVPGTRTNIEALVSLDSTETSAMGFDSVAMLDALTDDKLDTFVLGDEGSDPAWDLLFDEERGKRSADDVQEDEDLDVMILTLSHSDTARIMADRGTNAGKGTQYFWLSKNSYDFFPPLTERNKRGQKATYSTMIDLAIPQLDNQYHSLRVTFEAENNLDFRLGTAPLKFTKLARKGDLAVIHKKSDGTYQLKLITQGTPDFFALARYALEPVGSSGKRVGLVNSKKISSYIS